MSSKKSLAREIAGLQRAILKKLGVPAVAVDVFLLPHREMVALKRRLIPRARPGSEPNVLAIPEPPRFPHPETGKRHLGEVYLNRDILKKAPGRAAPLLLHGILHLLGYDHHRKTDASRMERLEAKILADIHFARSLPIQ